jgi:hypothetical protein
MEVLKKELTESFINPLKFKKEIEVRLNTLGLDKKKKPSV